MDFLQEIMDSARELETPLSFWYWAALATISAVVKDNIWIARGGDYYNLYPNIYVMFHADSGLKKGPPVSFAKDLVRKVNNTRIISGRSSIQGILKELGTAYTVPGGKVISKSVAFIVSSELTSSIVEDKAAARILTDLYDRHYNEGEWKSLLKMETFQLKDPTVTMLTATNESQSDDFFTKADIRGGYFARTFIIYETEENTSNSLLLPLQKPFNRPILIDYLKRLSQLTGPFQPLATLEKTDYHTIEGVDSIGRNVYFSEAGKTYEDWYTDFKSTIKETRLRDTTGTMNRFSDSVLKVAMLLSLSESTELVITNDQIKRAIERCTKLIGNVRQTTEGKGGIRSTFAEQKAMVIDELYKRENHMITHAQLLKKYMYAFNVDEWNNQILPSLAQAGYIQVEAVGNVIIYSMPEKEVLELKNRYEGKIR
jgi:hypothetical protein